MDADIAMEEIDQEILKREILEEQKNLYQMLGKARDYNLSSSEDEEEETSAQFPSTEDSDHAKIPEKKSDKNPLVVPMIKDVEKAEEEAKMWFSKVSIKFSNYLS